MAQDIASIVIAGPGRSGTSLLVRLLDDAGMTTSWSQGEWFESVNAGGELRQDAIGSLEVVKNPAFTVDLPADLRAGRVDASAIRHVFLPVRNLEDAAASRVRNSIKARRLETPGGLWRTTRPTWQAAQLALDLVALVLALEEHGVPYSFLHYPRFATDEAYFVTRVQEITGADEEALRAAHRTHVDRGLVAQGRSVSYRDDLMVAWIKILQLGRRVRGRLARL